MRFVLFGLWSDVMDLITSNKNPVIKEIKALFSRKYREESRLYFIEGIRFVEEALSEKAEIERILISERLPYNKGGEEIIAKVRSAGFNYYSLSEKLFKEISDTESPQGIMAVLKARNWNLPDIIEDRNNILVLESLQDPGNMGTIIRTADAAGITGVILSKGCVDIYNPKVLRSTMGSVFRVPIYISNDLHETIQTMKSKGIKVYAAHLKGNINYFEANFKVNTAIVIGNEANGISDDVAEVSDMLVKIPMIGRAESLNASVAASLLMYESVRQRIKDE